MSEEEEKYIPSPGKIRPNQLITTFGPGSIVQTEHDSVLVMGIDFWFNRSEYIQKNHLYLEKITKKDHFRMPKKPAGKSNAVTIGCTSFPKWGFCKLAGCKRLQPHKEFATSDDGFFCEKHQKYGELLPARLVVTCKQGHLDEFPWVKWAHSNPDNPVPVCGDPKLKWKGGTYSSSLSSYKIECETCGAINSLRNATKRDEGIQLYDAEKDSFYQYSCTGQLPWLKQEEKCRKVKDKGGQDNEKTETAFGIIARASSLYYSKVIRGIIIPELAHPIVKYLQTKECKDKIDAWRDAEIDDNEKIAGLILKSNEDFKIRGYTKELIFEFMKKLSEREQLYTLETEMDLKKIEYDDLQRNESDYDLDEAEIDEEIVIKSVELDDNHKKIFKHIRQLPILTAVEVIRYFTRISPPGEITEMHGAHKHFICKIQFEQNGETKYGQPIKAKTWLPCVVKKGEGIFIVFNEDFINKCLNDKVTERLNSMIQNHKDWEQVSNWPSSQEVDEQFILLHSISHLLIKEISLASGYNEASISERIYSSKDMRGLLIYTTSAGDGSLGGLVRQIDLIKIINKALNNKKTCSRDPICINEDPKRMRDKGLSLHLRQNGSACFGCMMLPETSCENFNKMMDRKILVDENFGLVREIPDA